MSLIEQALNRVNEENKKKTPDVPLARYETTFPETAPRKERIEIATNIMGDELEAKLQELQQEEVPEAKKVKSKNSTGFWILALCLAVGTISYFAWSFLFSTPTEVAVAPKADVAVSALPAVYGPMPEPADAAYSTSGAHLTGITVVGGKLYAVVNNEIVQRGDFVGRSIFIKDIQNDYVVVEYQGNSEVIALR